MSLPRKYKIIFWSLLLVSALLIFFVLRTPYMRVRSIARTYNRWTDPAAGRGGLLKLFIASKYGESKLKNLVANDCKAITEYPDGRIESCTGYESISSLTGKWFVLNVDRVILSGPAIDSNDDGYIAKTTGLLNEKSEIGLWECELLIKRYGSKYLISRIKDTLRNPTEEELSRFQDMLKVRRYNPYKGFGGRYKELYTFNVPAFSPDGKRLVFSSFSKKICDIYIVNLDGSGLKRLTNTKYWEVLPKFSPDGKNIMFMSDKENYAGEYYLIDLDGSNCRRLVTDHYGVSEARFSPDDRYVAFTAQKGLSREVYIMNAEGGNVRQLTNNGNQCSSLIFSPNGKKLFFVQRWYDDKLTPPLIEEIFSINVDGTYLKQLTHAREENAHNEKVLDITDYYVFYISVTYKYDNMPSKEQPNNHEVWQMMYDGSAQIQILGGGKTHGSYTSTKVLPNGKEIVFVDDSSNSFFYVLQVRELDDSGKTLQLTNDRVYSEISASPDGKYVAYMPLSRSEETRGIRIVSIDGKEFWTICENLNDK